MERENGHGGGGGAECCRRMQRALKEESEKRFRQIEQSMKRKEELKTYVDQLKERISLRDEQIKGKDAEIAHQGEMIEELRDKDRRQISAIQELESELAVARKESNRREQELRGDRQKGRNDQRKKTRVTMDEIFGRPYSRYLVLQVEDAERKDTCPFRLENDITRQIGKPISIK